MNSQTAQILYLLSCAVNNKTPNKENINTGDINTIYDIASRHMVSVAVAYALKSVGYEDNKTNEIILSSIRKTMLFDHAWKEIKEKLEQNAIWYMPLKGCVLKSLYPKYGMREFSDFDILIDPTRTKDVREIMENLGFTTNSFGVDNVDDYVKTPLLHFEMHHALLPSIDELVEQNAYYKNYQDKLINVRGYEKGFTPEDFYLFMIAHEYKHYIRGGTGLRSLLDTYVFLRSQKLDAAILSENVMKLGIERFERSNKQLAFHMLEDNKLTETDEEILKYMMSSGTYGTVAHNVQNKITNNRWSKSQYIIHRFSVPFSEKVVEYNSFSSRYPLFYKYKILLPFLPFYRIILAILSGRFISEARAIKKANTKRQK